MRLGKPELVFLGVLLVLLGVTFGTHLSGEWVWDDVYVVEKNPNLAGLGGLRHLLTEDTWGSVGERSSDLYHPIPMAVLWALNALFGKSVAAFRFANVSFHYACVVLFAAWLSRRGIPRAGAAFTALLFAVHPLVVEPVMWVTAGNDTLATLGCLVALLAVPDAAAKRPWKRLALVFAGTLFAALCKEPYFALPAVVLVVSVVAAKSNRGRVAVRALASFAAVSVVVVLRHALGIPTGSRRMAEGILGLGADGLTIVWHFLERAVTFQNGGTTELYVRASPGTTIGLLALVLATFGALFVAWRRGRDSSAVALAGFGWFVLSLAPHALATPVIGMYGNRYAYFPMMGLFATAAAVAVPLARELRPEVARLVGWIAPVPIAIAALVSSSEALLWKDGLTLFRAEAERDPENPRALYQYAHEVTVRSGCVESLPLLERAASLDPTYVRAVHNVAGCLVTLRRYGEALAPAEAAYRLDPNDPGIVYNLAVVELALGDRDHGNSLLDRALVLSPNHVAARRLRESLR